MDKEEKQLIAIAVSTIIIGTGIIGTEFYNLNNKIKMQEEEIDRLKENYEIIIDEAYREGLHRGYNKKIEEGKEKYIILEDDRTKDGWDYIKLDDLMVVTVKRKFNNEEDEEKNSEHSTENILINTFVYSGYKDILEVESEISFKEYLTNIYNQIEKDSTKQMIKDIISDDAKNIEIINKKILHELKIDRTSREMFEIGKEVISDIEEICIKTADSSTKIYTIKK